MTSDLTQLTVDELLEAFEYAVKREYYDPIKSEPPLARADALRGELRHRLTIDKIKEQAHGN